MHRFFLAFFFGVVAGICAQAGAQSASPTCATTPNAGVYGISAMTGQPMDLDFPIGQLGTLSCVVNGEVGDLKQDCTWHATQIEKLATGYCLHLGRDAYLFGTNGFTTPANGMQLTWASGVPTLWGVPPTAAFMFSAPVASGSSTLYRFTGVRSVLSDGTWSPDLSSANYAATGLPSGVATPNGSLSIATWTSASLILNGTDEMGSAFSIAVAPTGSQGYRVTTTLGSLATTLLYFSGPTRTTATYDATGGSGFEISGSAGSWSLVPTIYGATPGSAPVTTLPTLNLSANGGQISVTDTHDGSRQNWMYDPKGEMTSYNADDGEVYSALYSASGLRLSESDTFGAEFYAHSITVDPNTGAVTGVTDANQLWSETVTANLDASGFPVSARQNVNGATAASESDVIATNVSTGIAYVARTTVTHSFDPSHVQTITGSVTAGAEHLTCSDTGGTINASSTPGWTFAFNYVDSASPTELVPGTFTGLLDSQSTFTGVLTDHPLCNTSGDTPENDATSTSQQELDDLLASLPGQGIYSEADLQ